MKQLNIAPGSSDDTPYISTNDRATNVPYNLGETDFEGNLLGYNLQNEINSN